MPTRGYVCSDCKKPIKSVSALRVGETFDLVGVHQHCSQSAKVEIGDLQGEGAKKQEKKRAQNAAAAKVDANKASGGKNEWKRTGTHHNPFKQGSATQQMAHFSPTANAARQSHVNEKKL
jgi:hypothetical protein